MKVMQDCSAWRRHKASPAEHYVIFSCQAILVSLLIMLSLAASSLADEQDNVVREIEILEDENHELSQEQLGEIMNSFGEVIKNELAQSDLIREIEEEKSNATPDQKAELTRLKRANMALAEDAQVRIQMAGERNTGQITQSGLSSFAGSFLSQVNGKLSVASSYIGTQLTALGGLASKLKDFSKSLANKMGKLLRWPSFLEFKITFSKNYPTLRSELYRHMIYLRTQTIVGIQNFRVLLRKSFHLFKATKFSDWTDNEYHETYHNPLEAAEDAHQGEPILDEQARHHLESLARQGKSLLDENNHYEDNSIEKKRKRRSVEEVQIIDSGEMDIDEEAMEDESEDSDDDDDSMDVDGPKNELSQGQQDAKTMDEFIGEVDTSDMDDVENIMDDALGDDTTFTPIDLRQTDCLIEAEDQYKCGMCYAIVVNVAASYYNCMDSQKNAQDGKLVRYNSRFTADCGKYMAAPNEINTNIKSCKGGRVSESFEFVRRAGVQRFMRYEQDRISAVGLHSLECAYPRPQSIIRWASPVPFLYKMRLVSLSLDEVDLHLRTVGPVFINIRCWKDFKLQGAGIYDEFKDAISTTIHSMLVVGHNFDPNGREYWVLMNSHGISFGEDGYVRIYTDSLLYFKTFIGGLLPIELVNARKQAELKKAAAQQ